MASFNDLFIDRFIRSELGRLPAARGGVLLDLGCGTRPYRELYQGRFAYAVGADYEIRGPIEVRLDAAYLPFPDESFDSVLLTEVIEHVPDIDRTLREISRVLKPGGVLLLTWPFNYMMHEIPSDYIRLTEFGMRRRTELAGMSIEHLYRRGNALMVAAVLTEFLAIGVCELLRRTPIVGGAIGKPLQFVIAGLFTALYRLYLAASWGRTNDDSGTVGSNLSGAVGHMSLWNLGYCARVRKPRELT